MRSVTEIPLHDGRTRFVVTVNEPAPGDTPDMTQYAFLAFLANNPRLLACGPARYESLLIRHNGRAWVAEATATAKV